MSVVSGVSQTHTYLDLEIGFTSSFGYLWDDKKSRADTDASMWRPQAQDHFYPLGDFAQRGYDDPSGNAVVAVVRGTRDDTLRPPTGFTKLWDSHFGILFGLDVGSFWRPIPPDGYVALGLVCSPSLDDPPSTDVVRCVRKDLVVSAFAGDVAWSTAGSGGFPPLPAFSTWSVQAQTAPAGHAYFAPGTFIGTNSTTPPGADPNAYSLQLNVSPIDPPTPTPERPKLHDTVTRPNDYSQDEVCYSVTLPWFAVKDPNLSPVQQLAQSPSYRIDRIDRYKLIGYYYNDTSTEEGQTFSWSAGTSVEESSSFATTTGIEFGGEWGGPNATFKFSVKLSLSFTYTTTTTKGWSQAEETSIEVKVPPETAVAAFIISSTYSLYHQDGSPVAIDVPYDGGKDTVYWTQFPHGKDNLVTVA